MPRRFVSDSHRKLLALAFLVFPWGTCAVHAQAPGSASVSPTYCLWYADEQALHQVATDTNEIIQNITVKNTDILAMNGSDCGVWAVAGKQLYKFDANAVQTQKIALKSLSNKLDDVSALVVDGFDNSVWMADEKTLLHIDSNGQLIGSAVLPSDIKAFAIGLDQSRWVLGKKTLRHYNAQGVLLTSQDLHKLIDEKPKYFALDHLSEVLWLANKKNLTQLHLNPDNQSPLQISLPSEVNALTLDPRTGVLWVATKEKLLSYGADGNARYSVDLKANDLRDVQRIAFDPVTQSLWVTTEKLLARFSEQGIFVASLTAKESEGALAVPAFVMMPTLSLVRPPAVTFTNNPMPTISYAYGALCNGKPCGLTPDIFSGYTLTAKLNQTAIGPFAFDKNDGHASFTPTSRLPEGQNKLTAQATDKFGHTSNIANDVFTVDTIPPKFVSISPAEGSVVTTNSFTIQGAIDESPATVILAGEDTAANRNISEGNLNFSFPVSIKEGLNTFDLSAWDQANNSTAQTLHITYQPNIVSIDALSPIDGAMVYDNTVLVTGTFKGSANSGITVNGVVAAQTGNRFTAQVQLQPGANTLNMIATTLAGGVTTKTITIVSTGASPVQVSASAVSGITPLKVDFMIRNNSENAIINIEADYNGDGIIDFTTTDPATLQFVYTTPGIYQAHFKMTDSQNAVTEKTVMINVQDVTQIDQLLQAQWNDMNSALVSGDKAKALTYLSFNAQKKFKAVFEALQPYYAQILASWSPPLRADISNEIGEYAVVTTNAGARQLFLVYFLKDIDGVWRLDSM